MRNLAIVRWVLLILAVAMVAGGLMWAISLTRGPLSIAAIASTPGMVGNVPVTPTPVIAGVTLNPGASPASTQTLGIAPVGEMSATPAPLALTPTPSAYYVFLPEVLHLGVVATPSPTTVFIVPPPTPNWPNGIEGLTNSKLSLHSLGAGDPYIMEFIRRVHPRVVKSVDDVGWLSEVKAVSSATVTIGRLSGQEESWPLVVDPAVAADQYIASQLERYRLNTGVDYWEGWNEYDPNDDAKLQWYAQFEAARACKMRDLGLRAAVGGFATGVPEYYEMEFFLPALEAAQACGGIFTLHEYNSPTLACGAGLTSQDRIPGAPDLPGVTVGYLSLRYRYWYEGLLKPRGLGNLPLVISELGIQGPGRQCGDNGAMTGGWKTYADWWVQNGLGPDGPQAYVNTLAWYDEEIRKDSYVIGATIFTAGALDASNGWHTFDLHDALVPLAYYATGVTTLPAAPAYP